MHVRLLTYLLTYLLTDLVCHSCVKNKLTKRVILYCTLHNAVNVMTVWPNLKFSGPVLRGIWVAQLCRLAERDLTIGLSNGAVRPSVYPSVCLSQASIKCRQMTFCRIIRFSRSGSPDIPVLMDQILYAKSQRNRLKTKPRWVKKRWINADLRPLRRNVISDLGYYSPLVGTRNQTAFRLVPISMASNDIQWP